MPVKRSTKSNVIAEPVLFVLLSVTVYTISVGRVSSPCVVTLNAAVTVSSSRMFAVALAVVMLTSRSLGLLIEANTGTYRPLDPSITTPEFLVLGCRP